MISTGVGGTSAADRVPDDGPQPRRGDRARVGAGEQPQYAWFNGSAASVFTLLGRYRVFDAARRGSLPFDFIPALEGATFEL